MLSRLPHPCVIGNTDSYKVTHGAQLPPGCERIYSYYESRGGQFEETVFFGLYYILTEYFSKPITREDIDYWKARLGTHFFGADNLFPESDWEIILEDHGGYLPIKIHAVPEGTVVPTHNVLVVVENTDDRLPWVTNYAETLICHLWYACTVATLSREVKKIITNYAVLTGADLEGVPFKLHDFGFRGVSSVESAAVGGAAHLINFMGTDTLIANEFLSAYYGADMAGFSIPASEHSTMTSWGGPAFEADAFRNMIKQFGEGGAGIFACVSDSYDIFNACENLWGGELLAEVKAMSNMLVVRPDSGDVVPVVLKCLELLGGKFGWETNDAGFRVLNDVRVIQGDGMDLHMIENVCQQLYEDGWSIDNIAFGMGGGLLQQVNRDTSKYAFKASATIIDGAEYDVWKDPVTDQGKSSKRGRLALVRDGDTFRTQDWYETDEDDDVLELVFENGVYVGTPPTLDEIRERAAVPVPTKV